MNTVKTVVEIKHLEFYQRNNFKHGVIICAGTSEYNEYVKLKKSYYDNLCLGIS